MLSTDIYDEIRLFLDDVSHGILDLTISFIDGSQLVMISNTWQRPLTSNRLDQTKFVFFHIIFWILLSDTTQVASHSNYYYF